MRQALAEDVLSTVTRVAEIGYEVVEFYAPYIEWTPEFAKEVRARMDDVGVRCLSTHTRSSGFVADTRQKAIELNSIIGSQSIVMSSPPQEARQGGVDEWRRVADLLAESQEVFAEEGIRAGYHNHQYEWRAFEGVAEGGPRHPMDVLADGTPGGVTLQLDVGTCVEMGHDPVEWFETHPGRIRNIHCKDWAPGEEEDEKGYRVLFGEGVAPWKEIFAAAESVGGVEFYLVEQEGSRYDEFETAERCLATWNELRA